MYSVETLEIPSLPEGNFNSRDLSDPLGLNESHRAFLTSDFALTWMWGEYQRWKFVKEFKETNFEGPEENLKVITPTLKGLILLRLGSDINPDNFPEISYRKVEELFEELKFQRPEKLISLQDPIEVVRLRLVKGGGWHSDKICLDYRKYEERCNTASAQWCDALGELGLATGA